MRRRLLLSTTMLMAMAVGYGRRAYADCQNTSGSNWVCSNVTVAPQTIPTNNSAVTTVAGFSANTAGDAITITGDGALSYIDAQASTLIATGTALKVKSNGDDAGTSTSGRVYISTNGALLGGVSGIIARNYGSDQLSIRATGDVTGTANYGIDAHNFAAGTVLSITTGAGKTVQGGARGISAVNEGSGPFNLTTNGAVTGGDYGIHALNLHGTLTITANGDVTGTSSRGIYAINSASAANLNISTGAGTTVRGFNDGIYARNLGSGSTSITANGNVYGTLRGIYGRNAGSSTDLYVGTGAGTTVSGVFWGIRARNYGTGELSIGAAGTVSGGIAIDARNYGTNLNVRTTANSTVSGDVFGVNVRNHGSGALAMRAYGTISANSYAIFAENSGVSSSLSIITRTVSGGIDGIVANNNGSGALSISAQGDVTGTSTQGIDASNAGTYLRVTTEGTVRGGNDGINARNLGSGLVDIFATGDVTGTAGRGISADNSAAGTTLSITTAAGKTVTGGAYGIWARNDGTGGLTISANSVVSSGATGIWARNNGVGALTITANGNVTGTSARGIDALNSSAGSDLNVTTGFGTTVSGGTYGIKARNNGTGALTITANGTVTGTSGPGIYALNFGTDLSVTGNNVSGGSRGIYARNEGTGTLTVNASSVTGGTNEGIYARNVHGSDLIVTSNGTVSGGTHGIFARNEGTGAVTISAYGNVSGGSGGGIYARNVAGTTLSVTTAAGTVSGAYGIAARNGGTGSLTITAYGNVTGTTTRGIAAYNAGTDLTVITGAGTTVSGYGAAIYANNAHGALAVTANGYATSTNGTGITAHNYGTTLSVTTGATVSGYAHGIEARNYGSSSTTISVNADVTGIYGRGISALNWVAATDLSITTAANTTVRGGADGIFAANRGTGALTITANGNVTGYQYTGISAYNRGTSLSVTTAAGTTVSGGQAGIAALNGGSGALTITANGNVYGVCSCSAGITATNFGSDLSVTTAAGTMVSGGSYGIAALNYGSGGLSIIANGNVSAGANGTAIYAANSGTNLSVTTAAGTAVTGGYAGIRALNYAGALTITANGNVTGTSGAGISAVNYGTTLNVTTAAGTMVSGGAYGILAVNYGTGALTITANGSVTGTTYAGIFAQSFGADLSVTTGTGTTISGSSGIYAHTTGSGALTITANGNVTGIAGAGIYARSAGGAIGITVADTGTVSSPGTAILTKGGAATVTVAGTVSGGSAIIFDQTGGFANRLELVTGASISGNVLGGNGIDTLGLSGTSSGSFNVAQLSSFEAGEKTGSGTWTLTGTNTGITSFAVDGGALIVNSSLSNAAFTVTGAALGGTGTLGNTSIVGSLFQPGSGTAGSSMTVNGTLGLDAASTYIVNVNPTTSSLANVSGAATLGGATVNAIFANGSYISKQYTILTAGSINGTFGALINGNMPANFHDTLSYDATHAYLNLILNFSTPNPAGLNGNQNNVANALIDFFNTTGGIPMAFATLNANGLSQASGEVGADVAQTGIDASKQFIDAIFDGAFYGGAAGGTGGALGFADAEQANAYAPKSKVVDDASKAFAKAMPVKAPSFESRWAVWASGYGGNSRISGDATVGSNTTTSRLFGAVGGASYHLTPNTQLGFALGGAGSSFNLASGFGSGKADILNAAVYGKHTFGAGYLAGLAGYSWQDTSTDRTVTIAGTDHLHAGFKAQALFARLEGGWRYATPLVGITPYAAVQAISVHLPSYGETATSGAGTFALNYAAKTVIATRNELGARFDKAMPVQGGTFTLKGKAAWAHDWNMDRAAIATFQALPGATFTVNGARPSADAALASLGAEMKWRNGWTLAASVDGEFSRTTASYAGKGSVKYAW